MVKEMQAAVRSSIEKTSIEVFNEVAARTPVDTGNARISWNISTGSPNFSTRSTGVTPTGNWSAESTPPTDPVVLANDFLLESHLDRVYIANGVPYIGVLEFIFKFFFLQSIFVRVWKLRVLMNFDKKQFSFLNDLRN